MVRQCLRKEHFQKGVSYDKETLVLSKVRMLAENVTSIM